MDRRELFGALGAVGAGLAGAGVPVEAGEHAPEGEPGRYMAPVAGVHHHFCGIHMSKKDPKLQFVTQHYCAPVGDSQELYQCLLFDSHEKGAKLIGVEYIISDRLYRTIADEKEKSLWHPHTYEVLAGLLIAPSMSDEDEMKFMRVLLNTWGKTWHTWPNPKSSLPFGEPLLIWSLTGDGQADPKVIAARDKDFRVTTEKIREKRVKAIGFEVPKVSLPKSMDAVGRQWTDEGKDEPTPTK